MIDITFDGPPDMDELVALAGTAMDGDAVRVRWSVDTEHAHIVDKAAIRALFAAGTDVKLEGTILPIQSVRAGGIGREHTIEGKMKMWADTIGDSQAVQGLCARLDQLRSEDVDEIVTRLTELGNSVD